MANFEFESNDSLGTANVGVLGAENGGQLSSTADKDFFRFDLVESALLGISFKLPTGATNSSYTITVLDGFGNPIFNNGGGADFSNISFSADAGTYYFVITANNNLTDGVSNLTFFTTEDYGLTVTTVPSVSAQGEDEINHPNDTAPTATFINLGHGIPLVTEVSIPTVIGNLSDVSDKDYYTFSSSETGVFQFKFDAPTNVLPDPLDSDPAIDPPGTIKEFFSISILDEHENVLVTHFVSGTPAEGYTFDFALNTALNPTGTYYVKIENGGSVNNINTQQYNFEINPLEATEQNSALTAGSNSTDYLLGTFTSDIIRGNAGNDIISGLAGSDSMDGGLGVDIMKGGLGNDTYIVDIATDQVIENSGQGLDKVIASVSYTLATNVENLVLAATTTTVGAIKGTGNALDNIIVGNSLANTLSGLTGNDTLDGGLGAKGDSLIGGAGNDTYYINNTLDVISDSAGIDIAFSKVDIKINNSGIGLSANVENLTLLEVGTNSDGSSPATYGVGNILANIIHGNSASNQLSGLAGNDTIFGGAGSDALIGGIGNDVLIGGTGSDFFVFEKALSATTNVDVIGDFESGIDTLQLSKLIFKQLVGPAGNNYAGELSVDNFHIGTAAADANDYIIYDSTTGNLFYDATGSAAGAQILFANLGAGSDLAYTDFTVL